MIETVIPSPDTARAPEVWADADGCLYTPAPAHYGPNFWFAFGKSEPISLDSLTGRDRPVTLLFDYDGKYVGPANLYGED